MKNKRTFIATASLLLYGIVTFALFLQKTEPSLSILIGEHQNSSLKNTPLLAENRTTFEIVATHDGLGIIAVRFNTYGRINNDIIKFRIKPKEDQNWTYTGNYKTDQFQNHELFPFGFPLNPSSKNWTYVVELESNSGTGSNHVSIDTVNPIIVSKYQYPATNSTPTAFMNIRFGFGKAFNLLTNYSTAFPLLFYFSPLLLYLLNLFSISKRKRPSYLSILVPAILILSAYYLKLPVPDHWELSLALTCLVYGLVTKVSYRFGVALTLLAASYLLSQALGYDNFTREQAAMWLYFGLILITIQIKSPLF